MNIAQEHPRQTEIVAMLADLDAYFGALYPAESNHLLDVDALCSDDVVFLVARNGAGEALGCGAIVRRAGYAEVKRMYVRPQARGLGLGRALLAALTERARGAGFASLALETGISQPEAIGLYQQAGFVSGAPFGDYQPDPLSLFMTLRLTP